MLISMKKFVTAAAIFGVFVVYSLGIRHKSPVIGKSTALATTNPAAATSTASGAGSAAGSTGSSSNSTTTQYKDGTYTGSSADAYYGNVQVAATISGGKLTDVKFLQYPNSHQTSVIINQQAIPYLKQEAIQSQSSNVQIISGATFTSQAFQQSLQSALSQA